MIQGSTVNATFAQITSRDTSNSAYVISSRAKDLTYLYAYRETEDAKLRKRLNLSERRGAKFTDDDRMEHLVEALSKSQKKVMTVDVSPPDMNSIDAEEEQLRRMADAFAQSYSEREKNVFEPEYERDHSRGM